MLRIELQNMNKFIILLMCLGSGTSLSAQSDLSFGLKAGLNYASFSGDAFDTYPVSDGFETVENNRRTAYHIAVLVEIPILEDFALQPEVIYSRQGNYLKDVPETGDLSYRSDYINIPVMGKLYLIEGFYAEAGPQLGILLNSEIIQDPEDRSADDVSLGAAALTDMDFGLGIGLGYKFNNGIFTNLRYNFGLTDIFITDLNLQNAVFAFSLGFQL